MSHNARMRRTLTAWRQGAMRNAGARQRLERHLTRCAACRETLRGWEEAERVLRTSRPEPVALPADTARAVYARALQVSGMRPDGRPARMRALAWSIGLMLLAITSLMALRHHAPHHGKPLIAQRDPRTAATGLADNATSASAAGRDAFTPFLSAAKLPDARSGLATGGSRSAEHHLRHRRRRRTHLFAAHYHHRRVPLPPPADDEMIAPPEPVGRLIVIVTRRPGIPVEVTHADENTPGYARAACFRNGPQGAGLWQSCMVDKDETGAETIQTQVALAQPGPTPELLVVKAATGAEKEEQAR